MKQVYSFDVFDTCLLRACAFPVDVFYETGLLLSTRHGLEPSDEWPANFAIARSNAEAIARAESGAEDVLLGQIWKVLHEGRPDLAVTEGIEAELRVEEGLLRPNPEILARVRGLRAQGVRILFISDTYLHSSFIKHVLKRFGFFNDGDSLYVSGELGLTKASGSLFRHILCETGIPACELVHCGDNWNTDVQAPLALGIRAKLYRGAWLARNERDWFTSYVDGGRLGRRVVGLMRTSRAQARTDKEGLRSFVSEFLGPFLVTFASWVVTEAKREGVHRLYFLSRDCYLLQRVAAKIARDWGGPECRYLYASRQALLLPTVRSAGRQELAWLVDDEKYPRIESLLAKLNLRLADCGARLGSLAGPERDDFRLRTQEHWERFWSGLAQTDVQAKICASALAQRQLALSYFAQEGLIAKGKVGLVDLGWRLNVQRAFNLILGREEAGRSVDGFYLGLASDRKWDQATGRAKALFDIGPRTGCAAIDGTSLFAFANVLEYIVSFAPHGTAHHYEQHGNVIEACCLPQDGAKQDVCDTVARLVDEYVEEYRQSFQPAEVHGTESKCVISLLIEQFALKPKKAWSRLFGGLSISSDQNNLNPIPLVRPLSLCDSLGFLLWGRRHLDCRSHSKWLEASVSMSGWAPRGLYYTRELTRKIIHGERKLF